MMHTVNTGTLAKYMETNVYVKDTCFQNIMGDPLQNVGETNELLMGENRGRMWATSTKSEGGPLHDVRTSMEIPGVTLTNPCRRYGIPMKF